MENLTLKTVYYQINDETQFCDNKEVKKEKIPKRQMVFNAELVEKLEETLINPIKNHHNYKIKPSRGVLLHGQSGLGKERARQFQS